MLSISKLSALAALVTLSACTVMPTGPNVLVLPGTGKSFEQFRIDDMDCRQYASVQIGGAVAAANDSSARSAALGTVLGAVAGAAMNGQQGAATGAGVGLLMGSSAGAGEANASSYGSQRRYDHSFVQCMYAKGHRVPAAGRFTTEQPNQTGWSVPPPPPPAGPPPPPPPDAVYSR